MPAEAQNLLLKIGIKVSARKAAVSRLDLKKGTLYLYFSETHLQNPDKLIDMIMTSGGRYELSPEQILKTRLVRTGAGGPLTQTKNILKDIVERVNT